MPTAASLSYLMTLLSYQGLLLVTLWLWSVFGNEHFINTSNNTSEGSIIDLERVDVTNCYPNGWKMKEAQEAGTFVRFPNHCYFKVTYRLLYHPLSDSSTGIVFSFKFSAASFFISSLYEGRSYFLRGCLFPPGLSHFFRARQVPRCVVAIKKKSMHYLRCFTALIWLWILGFPLNLDDRRA